MSTFQFKHFSVSQSDTTMKVGTDAMLLGSLISCVDQPKTILDIGTGTGVIALMMAQRFFEAIIIGLEIDEKACEEARINFMNSDWKDRLTATNEDVLTVELNQQFDLIVSNPPYYENSLLSENERTSRAKHAQFLPVDSLLKKAANLLTENGSIWLVIPSVNEDSWVETAKQHGLHLNQSVSVIGKEGQGEKRLVLAFSKEQQNINESSNLTIRDKDGNYSKGYIELTKEFHDRDLSK